VWKRGKREKDGNNRIGVLIRDGRSDLGEIKIVGPDGVKPRGKRSGALRELKNQVI